ncbi:hypothetical protein AGOR_G00030620 [Albula goreensis]|uniref:Uncharacterized protein n=1 Tax=Albula goreensis TaxID=1534307 RepID=A0A8T3E9Y9_9TELE|nr:hypothetical protein AGOR_G00030620 [Albula goreensis]
MLRANKKFGPSVRLSPVPTPPNFPSLLYHPLMLQSGGRQLRHLLRVGVIRPAGRSYSRPVREVCTGGVCGVQG